ncbi:MAG: hypothetical protein EB127_23265, partial [Alphaproteobacteria bacterium]|nr:hypothetical protein [Alphaproteobacteria bacterium]
YTAIYNKNNKEPYRYYYKDQLRFAKKLGPDIIPPFKGITISFGLYNEYYSKYYTQLGRGITFGLWGQI